MTDRSTKIILALLAAGIWANVAVSLRPAPAAAQNAELSYMNATLSGIHLNTMSIDSSLKRVVTQMIFR